MTHIDTDTLAGLLAEATPGPWCVVDATVVWTQINDPVETSYDIGYPVAEARMQKSFWNGTRWPEGQPEANARLIALTPELAAETIALRAQAAKDKARIERLEAALREIATDPRDDSVCIGDGWGFYTDVVNFARAELEDGE